METLLRVHAAHVGRGGRGADAGFQDAAVSQLPLLLSAYGAIPWRPTHCGSVCIPLP